MMALRAILVVLDDSAASDNRLDIATALARQHDAHLIGFSALSLLTTGGPALQPPGNPDTDTPDTPRTSSLLGWGALPPVEYRQANLQAAEKAERMEIAFRERARMVGLTSDWAMANGKASEALTRLARQADLVILGQVDPNYPTRPEARQLIEDVLMTSGRPILVIPYIGQFTTVGTKVIIGWNNSREAVRALNDALPLLAKAASITILEAVPTGRKSAPEDVTGADIARHLARHGIDTRTSRTMMTGISASDALLSRAADASADLLVVGGYGHTRLREFMLGGVTRSLLQHMTLPVLMSH
jgi:nucleotide-binding universal stress UspA family protein